MNVVYKEEQSFRQWWAIILLLTLLIGPFYSYFDGISENAREDGNYLSLKVLVIIVIVVLTIIFFFLTTRMTTTIGDEGIYIRYYPIISKKFYWPDIEQVYYIQQINAWRGKAFLPQGRARVYMIGGNEGFVIIMKNGNRYIVGTQNTSEMRKALKRLRAIR